MRTIALIVAVAIASHLLIFCLFDPAAVAWRSEDAVSYLREARTLQSGMMPNLSRGLGYPLFLAATLPLGTAGVLVAQSLITIGSSVASYFLLGKNRVAFWTAILLASSPFLALFDFQTLSETLYIQLLWIGFLLLHRKQWLPSGALIGVAAVVRDTLTLMPVALLPLAFKDRRYLLSASVATAIISIVPHAETRLGLNLWVWTWERNGNWYLHGLEHPRFPPYAFRLPGEKQAVERSWRKDDAAITHAAIERIESYPAATLVAWMERYPRLWIGTRTDSMTMRFAHGSVPWYVLKCFFFALNLATLALGLTGLARRRGLFAIPVAYIALIYIPFHNCEPRYSLTALPFLYFYVADLCFGPNGQGKQRGNSAVGGSDAGPQVIGAQGGDLLMVVRRCTFAKRFRLRDFDRRRLRIGDQRPV